MISCVQFLSILEIIIYFVISITSTLVEILLISFLNLLTTQQQQTPEIVVVAC